MNKRKKLLILQELRVAKPCYESWDAMRGDEARRHCEACGHSVINLSELTERAAQSVLKEATSKRVCVRYTRNSKGIIQFKPDSSWTARLRKGVALALAFIPFIFGALASAQAENRTSTPPPTSDQDCSSAPRNQQSSHNIVVGEVGEVNTTPTHSPQSTPPAESPSTVEMGYLTGGEERSISSVPDESKF